MVAAIVRKMISFVKRFEVVQVMMLHSALSKGNMQVHNMRKQSNGRYLVRVSATQEGIQPAQIKPFANTGLVAKFTGSRDQMENDAEFANYFADAMNGYSDETAIEEYSEGLAVYTEFSQERRIAAHKPADWGLQSILSSFGCDVSNAEMISDAGYGSSWIAVAFNAA